MFEIIHNLKLERLGAPDGIHRIAMQVCKATTAELPLSIDSSVQKSRLNLCKIGPLGHGSEQCD